MNAAELRVAKLLVIAVDELAQTYNDDGVADGVVGDNIAAYVAEELFTDTVDATIPAELRDPYNRKLATGQLASICVEAMRHTMKP